MDSRIAFSAALSGPYAEHVQIVGFLMAPEMHARKRQVHSEGHNFGRNRIRAAEQASQSWCTQGFKGIENFEGAADGAAPCLQRMIFREPTKVCKLGALAAQRQLCQSLVLERACQLSALLCSH